MFITCDSSPGFVGTHNSLHSCSYIACFGQPTRCRDHRMTPGNAAARMTRRVGIFPVTQPIIVVWRHRSMLCITTQNIIRSSLTCTVTGLNRQSIRYLEIIEGKIIKKIKKYAKYTKYQET